MTPFLLIPGLNCDARVYAPADDGAVAVRPGDDRQSPRRARGSPRSPRDILRDAPPRFALGGFSMGGYLALRDPAPGAGAGDQAGADRHQRPAPNTPELTETAPPPHRRWRRPASSGSWSSSRSPRSVHPDNVDDSSLYSIHRAMAGANGPEVYVRHQEAIIGRPDFAADAAADHGADADRRRARATQITPPDAAARNACRHRRQRAR